VQGGPHPRQAPLYCRHTKKAYGPCSVRVVSLLTFREQRAALLLHKSRCNARLFLASTDTTAEGEGPPASCTGARASTCTHLTGNGTTSSNSP
jgi:hypothetical protein